MSILMGPYDKPHEPSQEEGREDKIKDLMVFGYQCKLYRDDVKAELESSGSLLIPWMGDSSLMVDRYDIRNHFDDKVQFGIKPNLPYHMSKEEEDLEQLLDKERYMSLGIDVSEDELDVDPREQSSYSAIGFNYDNDGVRGQDERLTSSVGPELIEHPPTDTVDIVEDETDIYYDPPGLNIPFYIERPYSKKFQSIIERTALFISRQGQQMEIIIKTKQKYNPQFSFLHHDDRLFPYYKQLLHSISNESYTPSSSSLQQHNNNNEVQQDNGDKREDKLLPNVDSTVVKEEDVLTRKDSDSEDEHEMDLHPLLRSTVSNKKKMSPPSLSTTKIPINSAPSVTDQMIITKGDTEQINATGATQTSTVNNTYPGYDLMSAYYQASQMYQVGPPPPPPDLQPIVDRTADYVAKNGVDFQRTVIQKHIDDRRFDFLHPWNEFHNYYKNRVAMKHQEIENSQPDSMQRLTSQGSVSFRLSNKPVTTLQLPIGGIVDLHEEDEMKTRNKEQDNDSNLVKRQKLSGGQIDNEFKKFLSTVKAMLK